MQITTEVYGLLLLVVVLTFFGFVFTKLGPDNVKEITSRNFVAVITTTLFMFLLVVHLIEPQVWMSETLKVAGGVIAGALIVRQLGTREEDKIRSQQILVGKQIELAAKDISNVKHDLSKFEDKVVRQMEIFELNNRIVSHREIEQFRIQYDDKTRKNVQRHPKTVEEFKHKPIGSDSVRDWYNRQIILFSSIPGAAESLRKRIGEINSAGWEVDEIRFDFSRVNVAVIITTEKRLNLDSLTCPPIG